jgi:hypothetical protein
LAAVLDRKSFYEFLTAHRCAVLHASVIDVLNPFIVRHFRHAHGGQVGIASVNLLGADWFREEVERTLNRTPTLLEDGYYLAVDGRLTSYQTGRDAEAYGAALKAFFSSRSPADTLNERNARSVIAAFDALISRALDARRPSLAPARDPHAVLGITPTATAEEIDDAYRQRIREYHPDRVATMAQEIRELATQRTAEINAAYAELRRRSNE